jgi:hypothetical protein
MKKNYLIIPFLFFVILMSSCRGDQHSKLIGNWEQIPFTDPDSTTTSTYWQFYAGDALIIFKDNGTEVDSLQYTYNIDGSVFDVFSGADDPGYGYDTRDPRGQYWVDALSNEQFKATKRKHPDGTTDAVYVRIEMVKR